jgi:hypothetical protein
VVSLLALHLVECAKVLVPLAHSALELLLVEPAELFVSLEVVVHEGR